MFPSLDLKNGQATGINTLPNYVKIKKKVQD